MRPLTLVVSTLFLTMPCTPSFAQSCDPKSILIQDKNISINDETTRIAVLDQIDKDHFEEAKKSWQSGGSVVIEGLPISGYGNYEDFSSARDREKRSYRFDLNQKKTSVVIQQSLSDNALQAYVACLQTQRQIGVFVWASNTGAFAQKAIINIKWLGAVGGPLGKLENPITIDGATISDAVAKTIPTEWRDKETVSLIVSRKPDEDAIIVVKISGYTETFFIPKDPPQFIVTDTWASIDKAIGTDRDDKTESACLNAAGSETFVFSPSSPSIAKTVQGNDDPGHNKATLRMPLDPKRVCMDLWTHTSATGTTQSIKATLSVLKRTVTIK
jgi:hypothetical protein